MSGQNEDVKSFIEEILETSVSEAKTWFEAFKKGFPDLLWNVFLRRPVTAESVESIACGLSLQISRSIRGLPDEAGCQKLAAGHKLLREVHEKAQKRGIDIDLEKIDWIFAPGLEKIGQTLARAGF